MVQKNYFIKKTKQISIEFKEEKLVLKNSLKDLEYVLNIQNLKVNSGNIFFKSSKESYKFKLLLKKSVRNISVGFFMVLEIYGLGFIIAINKAKTQLRLNVGFNHSIFYYIPSYIRIKTKKKKMYLFCYSFFLLKNVVTEIKNFRKLSVYKLKGIKEKNLLYVKKD